MQALNKNFNEIGYIADKKRNGRQKDLNTEENQEGKRF